MGTGSHNLKSFSLSILSEDLPLQRGFFLKVLKGLFEWQVVKHLLVGRGLNEVTRQLVPLVFS